MTKHNWDMYWDLYWSGSTAVSCREQIRPHTPEQLVAEGLHDLLCRWDHNEGCDWLYFGWDDPHGKSSPYSARRQYLKKAEAVLQVVDESTIHKLITTLLQQK